MQVIDEDAQADVAEIRKSRLVVYHGPTCLDGLAAKWVAWSVLGREADYVVGVYQTELDLEMFEGRTVYLVDFSYKLEDLKRILEVANIVYIIDHHDSAIKDLADFEHPRLDKTFLRDDKSGCGLAWEFWKGRMAPMPEALRMIQDRDLWKFEFRGTKDFTAGLYLYNLDEELIDDCVHNQQFMDNVRSEGKIINLYRSREIQNTIKYNLRSMFQNDLGMSSVLITADGRSLSSAGLFWIPQLEVSGVPLINCPPNIQSELGNILAEENSLVVMYMDRPECREFSLRSCKGNDLAADCAYIARRFGGGGHKYAAGFKVPRGHFLSGI